MYSKETKLQEMEKKNKKWKDGFEITDALTNGAKDANTYANTVPSGISPAGHDVSLNISQFYSSQSIVHIAL